MSRPTAPHHHYVKVTKRGLHGPPTVEFGIPESQHGQAYLLLDGVEVGNDVVNLKRVIGIFAERIETLSLKIVEQAGEYGAKDDLIGDDVDLRDEFEEYYGPATAQAPS